jgi:hypothetical protein
MKMRFISLNDSSFADFVVSFLRHKQPVFSKASDFSDTGIELFVSFRSH